MRHIAVLRLPLLLSLGITTACSGSHAPTVIDGSSKTAFEETLAAARSDLGPKERVKFELAISEFKAQTFAKADDRKDYERRYRDGLDGLTAPAIVAKFDENAKKLGNDAADAIFDAKRSLDR